MMKKLLSRKNLLLFCVLMATMLISSLVTIRRLENGLTPVSLPVIQTDSSESALQKFMRERDEAYARDIAALQRLCDTEALDSPTRENAAKQMLQMTDRRERQTALEGALTQSGVYPCAAVITGGSVTIVTEKETLTDGERALVITLAGTHAGIAPAGVQVITGNAN